MSGAELPGGSTPRPPGGDPARLVIAGGGTGGHLMPALAIADAMRAAGWRVAMVGARRGVEAALLPTRDFPFVLLPFEPIYRRQWWRNLRWPGLVIRLLRAVSELLDREHPSLVLGTGGYVAGPVVWLAARRGIATAILEQDARPGLATRWLAGRVDRVFLGAPEAAGDLKAGPGTTVVVTGSPIQVPTPERRPAALARFGVDGARPVVLIAGGSQGSVAINELVERWLEADRAALADRLTILWVTGPTSWERFRRWHAPPAVWVIDFLDPMADGYAVADLVVCRAGMMTLAEITAWGLPSLLIPLPSAAADHQTANARALAATGAAIHLPQPGLAAPRLGQEVIALLGDSERLARMRRAALERGRPDALRLICDQLRDLALRQRTFSNS
jgi:UDP-N-acetylglucosamine--N-acetylmuramyl-(pentapeptide) pyrophosphoryl-undecaprenol N-acetylglucosamine transferase